MVASPAGAYSIAALPSPLGLAQSGTAANCLAPCMERASRPPIASAADAYHGGETMYADFLGILPKLAASPAAARCLTPPGLWAT
jgi:hypothetical protein